MNCQYVSRNSHFFLWCSFFPPFLSLSLLFSLSFSPKVRKVNLDEVLSVICLWLANLSTCALTHSRSVPVRVLVGCWHFLYVEAIRTN